jgi:four helix bundle protein
LVSQLRRAAVSVASNVAEGQGRITRGEFIQFLGHARGSVLEVETQLEIAVDLGFVAKERLKPLQDLTSEVLFLLNRLIASLRKRNEGRQTSDTSETSETSET